MIPKAPIALLLLCLLIGQAHAEPAPPASGSWRTVEGLPVLGALALHPDSGLVATVPAGDRLLHLSPEGQVWRQAGGSGSGAGGLRRPEDLDTGQGLGILVLDRENHRLATFSRSLAPLSTRTLPRDRDGNWDHPGLLASGGAGSLVVADPRTATVLVSRDEGRSWQPLLDFHRRADSLDHIDALVLAGLDLWLLQRRPARLVRLGVDHTRAHSRPAPDLLLIAPDRSAPDGLARLCLRPGGLRLESGAGSQDLPPLPDDAPLRDLQRVGGRIWLSRVDAPALVWGPDGTGPR